METSNPFTTRDSSSRRFGATANCTLAFGWADNFEDRNLALLDSSQKPYYMLFCIQRWLGLILDLLVTALAVILMVLVVSSFSF